MIFFSRSILFSIDTIVVRTFIQSNIYLALKLEAIHLHDKYRHSEIFAIDILDNLVAYILEMPQLLIMSIGVV